MHVVGSRLPDLLSNTEVHMETTSFILADFCTHG